jgi:hypothetical protein
MYIYSRSSSTNSNNLSNNMGCYIIYRHTIGQHYSAHGEDMYPEDKAQFGALFSDLYLGAEA